ncbi:hypothetical protein P153DRAFT_364650 [Dothidotthia symphoricarpi CBS 119687]|uniref:Uncharacterized protein n=1 Tax=Dothidotthia symphoricarpi CBS 119687 TaxID=1392245 RepID=A0A6A6AJR7_9PLEO|nr:uncharacterized protein P153DRAFT_364650 [Dothidotthia symphoricarpi CBS 119687]KAF2132222.1 hypothetical protein P153DRAFT_364650 [Dothidotthia symphoricarpi CBS 119687]
MPEITFIFGPNKSFFFDCPKEWKFHAIPVTLRQLLSSSVGPTWRIMQPYCVALAPSSNSADPSWYIGGKTLSGEDKIFYDQNSFEKNYPDLCAWTKTIPNAPQSCFVTFGQKLSYFASAPGRGSIWAGIPSELEDKVRKAFDTPCCVSLGASKAWFVLWPDGYYSWKFYGSYGALNQILTEAEPRSVAYLAISPYNKEHYFVAFRDRSVRYNFTGAPPDWMKLMTEVFDGWVAERMQGQQQPYTQPYHPLYEQKPVLSSPTTPLSPASPLSPMTPNTPLPMYSSPVIPYATPSPMYEFRPPQLGAIEMPAESAGPALSVRSGSTDKKKKFFSRLF